MFLIVRPRHAPLFYLELVIDQEGVHYTSNIHSFASVMVSIFDRGIHCTHSVPQLEKVVSLTRTRTLNNSIIQFICMYMYNVHYISACSSYM